MKRGDQSGAINVLLIPFILLILFLIGAGAFGYWAFTGRRDYKDNTQQKINTAVDSAVKVEDVKKDAQFAQDYKLPLKVYDGPDAYGSIKLSYPKTWSGYVNDTGTSGAVMDGYFSPGVVPALDSQTSVFALRLQVVNQDYASVIKGFSGYVSSKNSTIAPYTLPNVKSVVGSRIEGEIASNKQGSMVIVPMRDKTLKIWTESADFKADLDNTILANFTFSP